MTSPNYKSKPADIFLIAGGPQSKNTKAILAEVLKSSNTNLQSKVYRGGKEEATQAYSNIRRGADDAANKGRRMNANWYKKKALALRISARPAMITKNSF